MKQRQVGEGVGEALAGVRGKESSERRGGDKESGGKRQGEHRRRGRG